MGAQEQISITEPLVQFEFQAINVPDAAGNAKTLEVSSNEYLMPWAGSVVGIAVRSNAPFTGTNTETWRPTINGTAKTALSATTSNAVQGASSTCKVGTVPFAAGVLLGVDWVKTGTVAPTTNDVTITLYVQFVGVFT